MSRQTSEDLSGGTLYVVATPIGNLGDVTLRALEVLRSVPLVVAEDTRLTRRLWARHEITTRMESFHAHSGPSRLAALLDHLAKGSDLALVTAALAALVASGLPCARFAFEGFLPRRGKERRDRLAAIAQDERTTILFEAPGRAAATLADLAAACGVERPASLSRELTKLHEETWRGSLADLAARAATTPPRGEITIVVSGREREGDMPAIGLAEGRSEVDRLVGEGLSRSSAAREVSRRTGLARRELFRGPG